MIYFTSDLHIGHDRPWIVQARGFSTIEEHDSYIKAQIAGLDAERLIVVGDFFMGMNKSERMADFLRTLHFPVTLVLGNHDPKPEKCVGFDQVVYSLDMDGFHIAHVPAELTDRYDREKSGELAKFQAKDTGVPIIHGHTHEVKVISKTSRGTLQIHVGWDTWRQPMQLSDLEHVRYVGE